MEAEYGRKKQVSGQQVRIRFYVAEELSVIAAIRKIEAELVLKWLLTVQALSLS